MKTVYLAGLISTEKPESLYWRKDIELIYKDSSYLKILSPMRGKDNLKIESSDGGITTSVCTSKDIINRDHQDVLNSDIILAYLEDFGSTRPLLGTIVELGWAYAYNIPVIAVCNKDNYLMHNHPFVKEIVSHYFETIVEAINFISHYYRD